MARSFFRSILFSPIFESGTRWLPTSTETVHAALVRASISSAAPVTASSARGESTRTSPGATGSSASSVVVS